MNIEPHPDRDTHADDGAFYIGGQWQTPQAGEMLANIDPATENVINHVACGSAADVDRAVAAARQAFPDWAATGREQRLDLLDRVIEGYAARETELAAAISLELGAPIDLARSAQVAGGLSNLRAYAAALSSMELCTPSVAGSKTDMRTSRRICWAPFPICAHSPCR